MYFRYFRYFRTWSRFSEHVSYHISEQRYWFGNYKGLMEDGAIKHVPKILMTWYSTKQELVKWFSVQFWVLSVLQLHFHLFAPTSVPVIASVPAASSSVFSVNNELLFDSSISDVDLIEIVDCASQTYERERSSAWETEKFVPNESRYTENNADESGAASQTVANVTQSNNNLITSQSHINLSLNAILARSFKSVHFERFIFI